MWESFCEEEQKWGVVVAGCGGLGDHSQEYRIPTLSGGDRDPIPGEDRTRGVWCSCPSSVGAWAPLGTGVWGPVRHWPCSRAPLLGAHRGHSAQVGALHVAGGWHHCPSPARKRCLLTEASIVCELMRQAPACKPAAPTPCTFMCTPGRLPGVGLGSWGPCGCVVLLFVPRRVGPGVP